MQTVHAFPLEDKGVRTGPRSCHVLVQFILEQGNIISTVDVYVMDNLHVMEATEWI